MNGADRSVAFTNHRDGTASAITTHPENQTAAEGDAATFSIAATGSPAPDCQWQVSTDGGGSWSNVTNGTGGTSAHYTTPAATMAMDGYRYRCIASNGISPAATSNAATLTVTATPPPAPNPYRIIEGQAGVWTQGGGDGLRFTANADHGKFRSVSVDGATIASDKFTVQSGSTVVTLKAAYLETLSVGRHTLRITFTDGYAETYFTVNGHADVPKTGDSATPALWLGVMLVAGAALTVHTALYRRKRRSN